jgi:hypothetical protein
MLSRFQSVVDSIMDDVFYSAPEEVGDMLVIQCVKDLPALTAPSNKALVSQGAKLVRNG